jgi:hypothetical protein
MECAMNAPKVLLTAAAAGFAIALTVWATTLQKPGSCPAPSARSVTSLFAPCLEQQAYAEPPERVLPR